MFPCPTLIWYQRLVQRTHLRPQDRATQHYSAHTTKKGGLLAHALHSLKFIRELAVNLSTCHCQHDASACRDWLFSAGLRIKSPTFVDQL
jgi:hypothetical protein